MLVGCSLDHTTIISLNGRIRLPVSTVNRTYELSGINHVTPFRKYGNHSTGPSTYEPWVRTCSKLFSCKSVLTGCSYEAQSNEICTYGRVSRGSHPRVRRYGLLYLRTVEYDHWFHRTQVQRWPQYEVRDLFPWEMFTKMVISCLLNVEKNLKLCTNKLKLDFKLLPKICFRRNNIHWEIDQWNRRRFGAKWYVTVPNSVAPVRPIVHKLIYMSQGLCCQMTQKLHVC